jgi:hypothetical protein
MDTNKIDALQKFNQRLNSQPSDEGVESTPDGKARTLVISHIEMTLDELFFGQWSTENFNWNTIANEVQGCLELVVVHPITGERIKRLGCASVIIMVDRVPDSLKNDPQARNQWALSPSNKKPNALDLAFPKLKAECLKNAAQSLGKIFGRDLNRKNADTYRPFKLQRPVTELPESTMLKLEQGIKSGADEFEIRNAMETLADLMSDEQKTKLNQLIQARQ